MHLPLRLYTTKRLLRAGGFVRQRPSYSVSGLFNWYAPGDNKMLVSEIKVSLFNTAYFASDSVQILDTTDYEATFRGELIELLYLTTVYRKPLKFTALASLIEALRNNADEDHPLRYHDCLELVASGLPVDTLKQFANSSASYEDFMQRDTELPFFLWLSLYSTKV